MPPARRPLRVPARLAFTIVLADAVAGCPQSTASDAGDVVSEQPASDTGVDGTSVDAGADANPADVGFDVPDDCQPVPYMEGYFECMPAPGADAGGNCGQTVCAPSMCAQGCVACPTRMYEPAGYACIPSAGGDAGAACESAGRVCNTGDCPAGCTACADPVYCSPDPSADVPVANCDPQYVCDPTGCPAGCTPLV